MISGFKSDGAARKKWGARGWSLPRSQVSPWDWLPSEGSWLHAGKYLRVSHSKVKASLFRDTHSADRM